jgi:hypothetical protein
MISKPARIVKGVCASDERIFVVLRLNDYLHKFFGQHTNLYQARVRVDEHQRLCEFAHLGQRGKSIRQKIEVALHVGHFLAYKAK